MSIILIFGKLYRKIKRLFGAAYTVVDSVLDGHNTIGTNTAVVRSRVGRYTYFGADCCFYESIVGSFCCIGNNVKIIAAQHPTGFISVHPFFYGKIFGNVTENTYPDYKLLAHRQLPPLLNLSHLGR